jgi:extracellular factor (EF) 3-hydroxypalmitic acid methyl ester biosynthesis protein
MLVVRSAAEQLRSSLVEVERELAIQGDSPAMQLRVDSAIDECLRQLAETGLWGRDNEIPSSELWRVAGPILERGWMQNRARTKPRGYAGDYELLGRMLRNQLCDDPLGRLFDRYFQALAAPIAVRNRCDLVRDWVIELARSRQQPATVVVVGSGPAGDIEQAVVALSPQERGLLRFRLLDYDPQALDRARERILPYVQEDALATEACSLFRIPTRPKLAQWLDGADLLVCVGMFDYLDDDAASGMLAAFYERLAPGGEAIVFNFSPTNTSRAYMEWIGNWYLLYRTADDMRRMVDSAGISNDLATHGSEPLGADLFVQVRKPTG